jgi:hypothetical protein
MIEMNGSGEALGEMTNQLFVAANVITPSSLEDFAD